MVEKMLSVVKGNNRFCGPAAVASLTGLTTDEASRLIRRFSGKSRTMGVRSLHMIQALRSTGIKVGARRTVFGAPTLKQWTSTIEPGCYLVTVTNHYMVVRVTKTTIQVVDSFNKEPTRIQDVKGIRRRVRAYRMIQR